MKEGNFALLQQEQMLQPSELHYQGFPTQRRMGLSPLLSSNTHQPPGETPFLDL